VAPATTLSVLWTLILFFINIELKPHGEDLSICPSGLAGINPSLTLGKLSISSSYSKHRYFWHPGLP